MARVNGIDTSANNGVINFQELKAWPVDFVVAKATEGLTWVDEVYKENHDRAKAADFAFGAYHMLLCDDDGIGQAEHFISTVDGAYGTVLPMVDFEDYSIHGQSAARCLGVLIAFTTHVDRWLSRKAGTARRILEYWEWSTWVNFMSAYDGLAGHPAWPAIYNSDLTLDMTGTGWSDWTIRQWSGGKGLPPIPGVPSPLVDRDVLNPKLTLRDILI